MKKAIVIIGGSIIALGLAGGMLVLLVLPKFSYWRASIQYGRTLDGAIREREELFRRAETLVEQLGALAGRRETFETLLPSSKDQPGLLVIISRLANARGVIVQEIDFPEEAKSGTVSFAQPDGSSGVQSFPLKIKAAGSYAALKSFLGALTNTTRLIDLRALIIIPEEGADTIRFDAELIAYYRSK